MTKISFNNNINSVEICYLHFRRISNMAENSYVILRKSFEKLTSEKWQTLFFTKSECGKLVFWDDKVKKKMMTNIMLNTLIKNILSSIL